MSAVTACTHENVDDEMHEDMRRCVESYAARETTDTGRAAARIVAAIFYKGPYVQCRRCGKWKRTPTPTRKEARR